MKRRLEKRRRLVRGMPSAVLEAMAMAAPLVLSDIPGHRETAGDAAWYFAPGVADALGAALVEALNAPSLREERASKGLERVRRDYSLAAMVQRIEGIYQGLVADHQQSASSPG